MTAPAVSPPRSPSQPLRARGREWGVLPVLGVALPRRQAVHVWERNRDVYFRLWKTELVPPLLEPIMMFFAVGLGLGTYVQLTGNVEYIHFLGPGVMAAFTMFASLFEALWGAYFRLNTHGTYQAILTTPTRPEEITTGEMLWAASRGAINAAGILAVMVVLTPIYHLVNSPLALLTVPLAFGQGFLFAGAAQAYLSQARSVSQLNYFFSLFALPMFWFSGGFFPLDNVPTWASIGVWFTPLHHTVELNRALIDGQLDWASLGHLVWLIVVTLPLFWLALWTMRRRIVVG
jgi:lipooligosaccharide transport system permease protein